MNKRGTAFGAFNAAYGVLWFLGSVTMGVLYELPLRYKGARHHEEKRKIAQAAATLIAKSLIDEMYGSSTPTPTR